MFDCHSDLLTYVYTNKENVNFLKKLFKEIYNENNIIGGIFNLFFMSPKEMHDELGIKEDKIDVIEMLKNVDIILKTNALLDSSINYIYGIEGLDYLNKISDIDVLHKLGVRSVNIVWNNENKFGGGAKANYNCGLTLQGIELVNKLVEKNIAIDLSHANDKTFSDIIKQCKRLRAGGNEPIVLASHSNVRNICNHPRNLTDEQIKQIKEFEGIIGIVGIKKFCVSGNKDNYKQAYLENINYIRNLLGGTENICVASDEMRYYAKVDKNTISTNVFTLETMKKELNELLYNYTQEEREGIITNNFIEKILSKIKE